MCCLTHLDCDGAGTRHTHFSVEQQGPARSLPFISLIVERVSFPPRNGISSPSACGWPNCRDHGWGHWHRSARLGGERDLLRSIAGLLLPITSAEALRFCLRHAMSQLRYERSRNLSAFAERCLNAVLGSLLTFLTPHRGDCCVGGRHSGGLDH